MPWAGASIAVCWMLVAGLHIRRLHSERSHLRTALGTAAVAERAVHLVGRDLREVALRLHGLAKGAVVDEQRDRAELGTLAHRCRLLAEDLLALRPARAPVLRVEPLDLLACVEEAARDVAAMLSPGRRQIRIDSAVGGAFVPADRRAIREVLRRVLGEAALNTREQDSIRIRLVRAPHAADGRHGGGGLVLTVADEGAGLGAPDPGLPDALDTRGVGTHLSQARRIMQAHGGALDVETAPGAGTRVSLWFPTALASSTQ